MRRVADDEAAHTVDTTLIPSPAGSFTFFRRSLVVSIGQCVAPVMFMEEKGQSGSTDVYTIVRVYA